MIDELTGRHAVSWLCRQLGVARSGYYAWRQRQEAPGKRAAENARLFPSGGQDPGPPVAGNRTRDALARSIQE